MRILQLTSARIPSTHANSVQTLRMAEALAALGHSVLLSARAGGEPGLVDEVETRFGLDLRGRVRLALLRPLGPKGLRTLSHYFRIRRLAKHAGPFDLVYSRDLLALAILDGSVDCTLVWESHRQLKSSGERLALRRVSRDPRFSALVVVSRGMRDYFLGSFPFLREEAIHVIPGAASAPSRERPPRFETWPGQPHRPQAGYVGNLYSGRGYPLLRHLAETMPQVDFHIIGRIELRVPRERPPNLHLHGFTDHGSLGWYYDQLDLVLAPYEDVVMTPGGLDTASVMSPLKIFEYMASRTPMIASRLPAIEEVLSDGKDALLVPFDDRDAWRRGILTLLEDEERARQLVEGAYRRFQSDHTWEGRARRIGELTIASPRSASRSR